MCLIVYLGVEQPLDGFGDVAVGEIGLDPAPATIPAALAGKASVYAVADRVPTGWNCSCIFIDQVMPWEADKGDDPDDPETPVRASAYAGLRKIAAAALDVDPEPLVFSCWSGDEGKPPGITRDLTPEGFQPARYVFDDVLDGGSGGTPPVLIRLQPQGSGA